MNTKFNHLVFYDGECGLCDRIVQGLIKTDKNEQFAFAPLKGVTAELYLRELPADFKGIDSLVLVEDYKINPKNYIQSRAAFRICWLLGGVWVLIGWLSFLPSFFFDWAYRIVARNRQRFFRPKSCFVPPANASERFLP